MIQLHRFIFCLIFISHTLHTQTPEEQYNSYNKQSTEPKKLGRSKESESFFRRLGRELGIYKNMIIPALSEFDNNNIAESDSSKFHNDDIAELEMVFESSPQEAQQIVSYLKNTNAYKKKRGYIFFCGKTRSRKNNYGKSYSI